MAVCLPLLACGGADRPPPIDLNPAAGGAPEDGNGGPTTGGGKNPSIRDLREGGFINIPQVSDISWDDQRGLLYVSTTDGVLATVTLADGKIAAQQIADGPLLGLDLSPEGSRLAVGDISVDLEAMEYWVHVLDLEARTLREVYLPLGYDLQEGAHGVAFADEQTLYLCSSFTGGAYVPLVRVDLRDDSFASTVEVRSDSMLARSLDNDVMALASPRDIPGRFLVIDPTSQEIQIGSAGIDVHDVALNRDGSKLAFPVTGGVKLLTRDDAGGYGSETFIPEADRDARAAIFSPVSDSLYVTWGPKIDGAAPYVARYNVGTLEYEGIIQNRPKLAESREGGFQPTRMKISSDGKLLFVTVETGVNVIALDP